MLRKKVYIIALKGNTMLIVHKKNHRFDEWVFPGGGIKNGESVKEAALREFTEETSASFELLFVDSRPYEYLFEHPLKEDGTLYDGQTCVFVVGKFLGGKITLEEKELNDFKFVTQPEAKEFLIFPKLYERTCAVLSKMSLPQ